MFSTSTPKTGRSVPCVAFLSILSLSADNEDLQKELTASNSRAEPHLRGSKVWEDFRSLLYSHNKQGGLYKPVARHDPETGTLLQEMLTSWASDNAEQIRHEARNIREFIASENYAAAAESLDLFLGKLSPATGSKYRQLILLRQSLPECVTPGAPFELDLGTSNVLRELENLSPPSLSASKVDVCQLMRVVKHQVTKQRWSQELIKVIEYLNKHFMTLTIMAELAKYPQSIDEFEARLGETLSDFIYRLLVKQISSLKLAKMERIAKMTLDKGLELLKTAETRGQGANCVPQVDIVSPPSGMDTNNTT